MHVLQGMLFSCLGARLAFSPGAGGLGPGAREEGGLAHTGKFAWTTGGADVECGDVVSEARQGVSFFSSSRRRPHTECRQDIAIGIAVRWSFRCDEMGGEEGTVSHLPD